MQQTGPFHFGLSGDMHAPLAVNAVVAVVKEADDFESPNSLPIDSCFALHHRPRRKDLARYPELCERNGVGSLFREVCWPVIACSNNETIGIESSQYQCSRKRFPTPCAGACLPPDRRSALYEPFAPVILVEFVFIHSETVRMVAEPELER